MKKLFSKIHLWLSLPFGIIITLICFSGAMLVFEEEVMKSTHTEWYNVKEVKEAAIPMDILLEKVASSLPDSVKITGVKVFNDPSRTYQVTLSKPRRAYMFVDQYQGEIITSYQRAPFFTTMFRLHRWLLDSMSPDGGIFWGKMIVGTSTLLFVFILISGIVVWWPRSMNVLRKRIKINGGKGLRRFLYDLHTVGGVYVAIILLAMALTGLTWSFEWYRNGFYTVFGVETQSGHGHGAPASKSNEKGNKSGEKGNRSGERGNKPGEGRKGQRGGNRPQNESDLQARATEEPIEEVSVYKHWQEVYQSVKEINPVNKSITMQEGNAIVALDQLGNQMASDKYSFDNATGKMEKVTFYKDGENSSKIRGWIYSTHVGSIGGMTTRILAFLAALMGATLPLSGYYILIKRKFKRKSASANRS